MIDLVSGV